MCIFTWVNFKWHFLKLWEKPRGRSEVLLGAACSCHTYCLVFCGVVVHYSIATRSIFDDPALLAAIAKRGNMAHEPRPRHVFLFGVIVYYLNAISRGQGEGFRIEPSFLQLGAEPTDLDQKRSIKVNVFPSAPLDLTVKTRIDELDRKREDMERGFFEQAPLCQLVYLVQIFRWLCLRSATPCVRLWMTSAEHRQQQCVLAA